MNVVIRKATDGDIPRMMLLFDTALAVYKPASFFRWWNKISSVIFCAFHDDKLIGMFAVLKRQLNNGLTCGILMGLLLDKKWRGKGLFKKLGDKAMRYFEDIDLFCCLTNPIGKKVLEKNFNFRTVEIIQTMTLPIEHDSISCNNKQYPITFDTKFIDFSQKENHLIMYLADEDFRLWRYASHWNYNFKMVYGTSHDFVIVNTYHLNNVSYGDIMDFEVSDLDEETLAMLIKDTVHSFGTTLDMVTLQALTNSLLYKLSASIGFVESEIRHYFLVKVMNSKNEHLYDPYDWVIKWGDYLR